MKILSLKLENYNYSLSELKKYLESLKGISKVTINENENSKIWFLCYLKDNLRRKNSLWEK